MHGKYRRGPCNYGEGCNVLLCKFLHPAGWWATDRALACPLGARCMEEECSTLRHPKERDAKLRSLQEQREQAQQDAADAGVAASINRGVQWGQADGSGPKKVGGPGQGQGVASAARPKPPAKTKSREQRERDRQKAGFTILSCRETFIRRLLAERVVIITAGK